MKKSIKIIATLLLAVMIISMFSTVFAADSKAGVTDPGSLSGTGTDKFDTIGKRIIGMVQAIGSIVSVLILVVLGIKYMMGSAEEKAEYKKTMIPYLIGAILIFAASNIASMIYSFAGTLGSSTSK